MLHQQDNTHSKVLTDGNVHKPDAYSCVSLRTYLHRVTLIAALACAPI
ncbi:hypothetical protein BACINT_04182 [Bacteroides intestinalis DSM 17393]|uniref:Uncharacterized protein n=1 Tax=Bacteroides intestinalis DSM 17393 TaxID=471870 RepID=B3CEQ1_9BACE|nr:hypothetical protein BACINT_04182 [Bacteroides intestinalis DSM 17393]